MENLQEFNIQLVENYESIGVKNPNLERVDKVQGDILRYFNVVTLLLIPLYALLTFIIYRRIFNYAEHLVFHAYIWGTCFILVLIFFYLSLVTHPLVYSIASLSIWFLHAYIFGKLYRLSVGISVLKLLLYNIMLIVSIIIIFALLVLVNILIAHLTN